jgi:uncharacterized Fe-S radical SAM superfamily protein PflX
LHSDLAGYYWYYCLRGKRGSGTIFFSGCNLRQQALDLASEAGMRHLDSRSVLRAII